MTKDQIARFWERKKRDDAAYLEDAKMKAKIASDNIWRSVDPVGWELAKLQEQRNRDVE